MPLTTHMIHPRVSLLTPSDTMVGHSRPVARCLTLEVGDQISWCPQ